MLILVAIALAPGDEGKHLGVEFLSSHTRREASLHFADLMQPILDRRKDMPGISIPLVLGSLDHDAVSGLQPGDDGLGLLSAPLVGMAPRSIPGRERQKDFPDRAGDQWCLGSSVQ